MNIRPTTLMSVLSVMACTGASQPPGPPFRAQLLAQDSLDPETGKGRFSIAPRALHHLDDFDNLSGPLYRIYRGGEARIRVAHGSVVVDGSFDHGKSPDLRYVVEHGVAVPRDYPTLMMLSAAYQFELVFDALEANTGYSAEDLTARLGLLRVFFEPTIVATGDGESARVSVKRNAFFDPSGNVFGLARRSSAEDVPLAADPKVIAHELGHAVFFRAFADAKLEKCDPKQHDKNEENPFFPGRFDLEYVVSGLNEGFADFHSFAITGGVNPLANLESAGDERSLGQDDYDWDALAARTGVSACSGGFYCVGTLFSRSLYAALMTLGLDPLSAADRADFMRSVVRALTGTKARLVALDHVPLASDSVAGCQDADTRSLSEQDGQLAGAFLEAWIAGLPDRTVAALCPELTQRFGASGFPEDYRSGCP